MLRIVPWTRSAGHPSVCCIALRTSARHRCPRPASFCPPHARRRAAQRQRGNVDAPAGRAEPAAPLVMLDPGPWRQGSRRDRRIRHLRKACRPCRPRWNCKRRLEAAADTACELTRTRDVFIPLGRPGGDRAARAARRCSSPCTPMRSRTIPCAAPASIPWRRPRRTRRPPHWRGRENSADRFGGRQWRDTSPEVGPNPRQPGAAGDPRRLRCAWRAAWSAASTRICRCCRTRRATPASWC